MNVRMLRAILVSLLIINVSFTDGCKDAEDFKRMIKTIANTAKTDYQNVKLETITCPGTTIEIVPVHYMNKARSLSNFKKIFIMKYYELFTRRRC